MGRKNNPQKKKERKELKVGNHNWFVVGKLEAQKDGVFVVHNEEVGEVVIVKPKDIKAFSGDVVEVAIVTQRKNYLEGIIVRVVERLRNQFVGTIDETKEGIYFIPQEGKIKFDFVVPSKQQLMGAISGQKVVVHIIRWEKRLPEVEVVKILGNVGDHNTEMHAILLEFGIDTEFDTEVLEEAEKINTAISPEEIAKRRDFRKILTFTIDPIDAKDFDDALSIRYLENGNYEIGVHIADVTHYVKDKTNLDKEAIERATSIYLVDRTIPMLPEKLSNNLCSLRPNEDSLTFSAVFELNDKGKILSEWFGKTVIHSIRRFHYEEVQDILDSKKGDYVKELLKMNELAYQLRKQRFAQGSIDFDTDEVRFQLDKDGKPLSVVKKLRLDAHRLIEDFMLLANKQVATYLSKYSKKPPKAAAVYRIHPLPDEEKLLHLQAFIKEFGYDIDTSSEEAVTKSLNDLVMKVEGKPEQNIIRTVAIKAMQKAIYTTQNIGHYGLGFKFYTHFTSPIRRYPDMLVHRVLYQALTEQKPLYGGDALEQLCKHCSNREKRAADAERASIKYKSVEFLATMLGNIYEGTVSGVTEWGIYVEIDENRCEGMVLLSSLRDDHYALDKNRFQIKGQRTRRVIRLGDKLKVKVKKTNLMKRTADFELVR